MLYLAASVGCASPTTPGEGPDRSAEGVVPTDPGTPDPPRGVAGYGMALVDPHAAYAQVYSSIAPTVQDREVQLLPAGEAVVTFPGLGRVGGNVQVTTMSQYNDRCTIQRWAPDTAVPTDLSVRVRCTNAAGWPSTTGFLVFFRNELPPAPGATPGAYLFSTAGGVVSPLYSFNETGFSNTVTAHWGGQIGRYRATLQGLGRTSLSVHVTAYGALSGEHCKIVQWFPGPEGTLVDVACFNASGAPTDMAFALNVADRGMHNGPSAWHGVVQSDVLTRANYSFAYGEPRDDRYAISIAPQLFDTFEFPFVTAYGSDASYCNFSGHLARWNWDTPFGVKCYDGRGALLTSKRSFTASIVSEPYEAGGG